MTPKLWFESRTLWSVVLFLALLAAYCSLRAVSPEAIPEWLLPGLSAAFAALVAILRGSTSRPLARRKGGASSPQGSTSAPYPPPELEGPRR